MTTLIAICVVVTLFVGPAWLGTMGWLHARRDAPSSPRAPWDWTRVSVSALLYTLAFNLTFFVQELFLVLPKALTPGLHPTLFHNNHRWEGQHELASLFQGTGALATALVGLACLLVVRKSTSSSMQLRLGLLWMAYCGVFMALPQVVIGALSTGSDVGMAMEYLQWSPPVKTVAALLALIAMPLLALAMVRPALALAGSDGEIATARARARVMLQFVVIPAVVGTALVIPFRVPRELIEVVLLPVLVMLVGVPWMLAGAWRVRDAVAFGRRVESFVLPLLAAIALLLVFQLLLRPGVEF